MPDRARLTPPGAAAVARLRAALERMAPEGLVSAYLFGGTAEGRAHPSSDIDVGVLLDYAAYPTARARFDAQLDLRRHLSPAVIGHEIDLVVMNDVSPLLARRIVDQGRREYCADARTDHAFRRDIRLRAADLEPFMRRMRRLMLDAITR